MEQDTRSSLFGSFFGYFIAHSTLANLVLVLVIVLGFFLNIPITKILIFGFLKKILEKNISGNVEVATLWFVKTT